MKLVVGLICHYLLQVYAVLPLRTAAPPNLRLIFTQLVLLFFSSFPCVKPRYALNASFAKSFSYSSFG